MAGRGLKRNHDAVQAEFGDLFASYVSNYGERGEKKAKIAAASGDGGAGLDLDAFFADAKVTQASASAAAPATAGLGLGSSASEDAADDSWMESALKTASRSSASATPTLPAHYPKVPFGATFATPVPPAPPSAAPLPAGPAVESDVETVKGKIHILDNSHAPNYDIEINKIKCRGRLRVVDSFLFTYELKIRRPLASARGPFVGWSTIVEETCKPIECTRRNATSIFKYLVERHEFHGGNRRENEERRQILCEWFRVSLGLTEEATLAAHSKNGTLEIKAAAGADQPVDIMQWLKDQIQSPQRTEGAEALRALCEDILNGSENADWFVLSDCPNLLDVFPLSTVRRLSVAYRFLLSFLLKHRTAFGMLFTHDPWCETGTIQAAATPARPLSELRRKGTAARTSQQENEEALIPLRQTLFQLGLKRLDPLPYVELDTVAQLHNVHHSVPRLVPIAGALEFRAVRLFQVMVLDQQMGQHSATLWDMRRHKFDFRCMWKNDQADNLYGCWRRWWHAYFGGKIHDSQQQFDSHADVLEWLKQRSYVYVKTVAGLHGLQPHILTRSHYDLVQQALKKLKEWMARVSRTCPDASYLAQDPPSKTDRFPLHYDVERKMDDILQWAKGASSFNVDYIDSVRQYFREHGQLTRAQEEGLDNIIKEWKVPNSSESKAPGTRPPPPPPLAEEQKKAWQVFATNPISVVHGIAGTGKSQIIRMFRTPREEKVMVPAGAVPTMATASSSTSAAATSSSEAVYEKLPRRNVAKFPVKTRVLVVAFTNDVVNRSRRDKRIDAVTIHYALEYGSHYDVLERWDQVECVVFEEVGMIDERLFLTGLLWVLQLPRLVRILCLGDPMQLPSVSPGCVLRDLLTCTWIPNTRLLENHRVNENARVLADYSRWAAIGLPEQIGGPSPCSPFRVTAFRGEQTLRAVYKEYGADPENYQERGEAATSPSNPTAHTLDSPGVFFVGLVLHERDMFPSQRDAGATCLPRRGTRMGHQQRPRRKGQDRFLGGRI